METVETLQKEIRSILGQQGSVPKPPTPVSLIISNLRDLIDLNGSITSDWRRGAGATPSPTTRFRSVPSSDSLHSSVSSGIPRTPMSPSSPPPPVAKYQSKFKNSNQPVEDKILNNIILSKLNKFSPKTYNEIRDFLYQILGSGDVEDLQEMTRDFMRLVFRKAAIEEMFCPLYAKLLCEISERYKVILEEMQALQANYLSIFDDIQESESNDYDTFVENQKSKQYRKGYSQFLAELTALEILNLDLLNSTFQRILANMVTNGKLEDKRALMEDYSDCLVRMAKVLKKRPGNFFGRARQVLLTNNLKSLEELTGNQATFPSMTVKARFILMDVIDILKGV